MCASYPLRNDFQHSYPPLPLNRPLRLLPQTWQGRDTFCPPHFRSKTGILPMKCHNYHHWTHYNPNSLEQHHTNTNNTINGHGHKILLPQHQHVSLRMYLRFHSNDPKINNAGIQPPWQFTQWIHIKIILKGDILPLTTWLYFSLKYGKKFKTTWVQTGMHNH